MTDMENEPIHDDFDDFEDIVPKKNDTNKKSDLDDLESIKSEENQSPKGKPKKNKGKNDFLNSFNKSLNDSGAKPEPGKKNKVESIETKKQLEEAVSGSFDENFDEKSLEENKANNIKQSEINDDSFLEKEKQALKPSRIKKSNENRNKENNNPLSINTKLQERSNKSNFKKSEAKNTRITPVIKNHIEKKKNAAKKVDNQNKKKDIYNSAFTPINNKLPAHKESQVKDKGKVSVKNPAFSIMAVVEENKQLFEELKHVNDKLTTLIEEKGYQNQLEKIRENNTEFKYRPVNVKVTTYDKEIKNNQKIIEVLTRELNLYKDTVKKLDSTELLNDLNRRISNYNNNIKTAKASIYQLQVDYKKNETALKNKDLEDKKAIDFKKLMMELDSYMTKNTELNEKIQKLETLKAELLSDADTIQKEQKQVRKKLEDNNLTNFDENIVQKHKNLLNIKKRWDSHIVMHEKNIDLKLKFAEKDTEQYDKEIEELKAKIEAHDNILQKQASGIKSTDLDPNGEPYNFKFIHDLSNKKLQNKDFEKQNNISVERNSKLQSGKKANKNIPRTRSKNKPVNKDLKVKITTKSKSRKLKAVERDSEVREKVEGDRYSGPSDIKATNTNTELNPKASNINSDPKSNGKNREASIKNQAGDPRKKNMKNIKTAIDTVKKNNVENDSKNFEVKTQLKEPMITKQAPAEKLEANNNPDRSEPKRNENKPIAMERKDSLDDILEVEDKGKSIKPDKNDEGEVQKHNAPAKNVLTNPETNRKVDNSIKNTENDDDFDFLD